MPSNSFNPDALAEEAAEKAILRINDVQLCEWLAEIASDTDAEKFMKFLLQIRGGDHAGIGKAFIDCLRAQLLRGIDGDALAEQAYQDALDEARGDSKATEAVHREWERS